MKISEIKNLKAELINEIKTVDWKELIIEDTSNEGSNTRNYEVCLPQRVMKFFDQIQNLISDLNHLKNIGREIIFQGDSTDLMCSIQIGKFDHRIHINGDGIARSIRNLGLGAKIYRAILEYENFITSTPDKLYDFGKIMWASLRKNDLFYVFFTLNKGYCFASDKNPDEIIEILSSEINLEYIEKILWDSDFKKLNWEKIRSSNLQILLE